MRPRRWRPCRAWPHHGARVSALIVRLNDRKTLAAIRPDLALTPASTSKLYVAASALQQWGADYRFTTRLLGDGPVENGVLKGNLVFAGAGDPALTTAQLFILTRRLAERGIHRVTGHLIVDAGYFGRITCTAHDRCHALDDSHNAYNALLSSAAIDFATAQISVIPASAPGSAATVHLAPFDLPGVRVVNRVHTGPAASAWSVRVDRRTVTWPRHTHRHRNCASRRRTASFLARVERSRPCSRGSIAGPVGCSRN